MPFIQLKHHHTRNNIKFKCNIVCRRQRLCTVPGNGQVFGDCRPRALGEGNSSWQDSSELGSWQKASSYVTWFHGNRNGLLRAYASRKSLDLISARYLRPPLIEFHSGCDYVNTAGRVLCELVSNTTVLVTAGLWSWSPNQFASEEDRQAMHTWQVPMLNPRTFSTWEQKLLSMKDELFDLSILTRL